MVISVRKDKDGTWIIPVKVQPKSAQDRVLPLSAEDIEVELKVSAPADKGEANAAVVALLAEQLNLPKSTVKIIKGTTTRQKQVALVVPWSPEACRSHLAQALSALPEWFQVQD